MASNSVDAICVAELKSICGGGDSVDAKFVEPTCLVDFRSVCGEDSISAQNPAYKLKMGYIDYSPSDKFQAEYHWYRSKENVTYTICVISKICTLEPLKLEKVKEFKTKYSTINKFFMKDGCEWFVTSNIESHHPIFINLDTQETFFCPTEATKGGFTWYSCKISTDGKTLSVYGCNEYWCDRGSVCFYDFSEPNKGLFPLKVEESPNVNTNYSDRMLPAIDDLITEGTHTSVSDNFLCDFVHHEEFVDSHYQAENGKIVLNDIEYTDPNLYVCEEVAKWNNTYSCFSEDIHGTHIIDYEEYAAATERDEFCLTKVILYQRVDDKMQVIAKYYTDRAITAHIEECVRQYNQGD